MELTFIFQLCQTNTISNGRGPPLAPHWFECWGKVIEVQPTGIRVSGHSPLQGAC